MDRHERKKLHIVIVIKEQSGTLKKKLENEANLTGQNYELH